MRTTLLLIHGFPHDHALWDPNVEQLRTAAQVIAPDLRGFGGVMPLPTAMTMEAYAADLHQRIVEQGADRIVLCGLSMGGYVALAFLERWPELVRGIILCNTRSNADTEEAKQGREGTAKDALTKGSAVIARAMIPKVLSERTRSTNPELTRTIEAMMSRQDPEALASASRGMALRPDRTHVLQLTDKPVLIITGANDALMPLPTSEAMVKAAPHAQMVVLPNAGHLSNVEAPGNFNAAVTRFLRGLDDRTPA